MCRMDAIDLELVGGAPRPIFARYNGNAMIIRLPLTTVKNAIAIKRCDVRSQQRYKDSDRSYDASCFAIQFAKV
jgi:hypothetical protein